MYNYLIKLWQSLFCSTLQQEQEQQQQQQQEQEYDDLLIFDLPLGIVLMSLDS